MDEIFFYKFPGKKNEIFPKIFTETITQSLKRLLKKIKKDCIETA